MAESDKDGFVRLISAHILGWFRVPAALPILKRIVEMEAEDPTVRQIAYEAILAILGLPPEAFPTWTDNLDFEPELVDRELLEKIQ
jgi:hypothetical protein